MSHAHERGFTLIELITVIAIIVIILGILFANFRNFGGTARLEEDVSELAAMIRSARQDSLSVRECTTCGTQYPSYGFYATTDAAIPANNIDSQAFVYTDNNVTDTEYRFRRNHPGNDVVQDIALSTGVTVNAVTYKQNGAGAVSYNAGLSVLFGRSSPVVYISRNDGTVLNSGTVEIRLRSSAGEVRTICVNSSGHVRTGFATCL